SEILHQKVNGKSKSVPRQMNGKSWTNRAYTKMETLCENTNLRESTGSASAGTMGMSFCTLFLACTPTNHFCLPPFRQNCILADEMGLGKTIQSITFVQEMVYYG